ncbi:MAG: flavin reductase family protein [Clostridia bacterium]|nr:flavin reductase family protein [Clostridia bacterium]
MRKEIKNMAFLPLPVLIIGTYDENNKPNAMNAAWGGIYDYNEVIVSLSRHKTTENLEKTKAFTIAFATKETEVMADYFGVVSGAKEDKIAKAGAKVSRGKHVNAPLLEDFPINLECEVVSFKDGTLIGKVVSTSVDERYLKSDGSIDVDKMQIICFDTTSNTYRILGDVVGKAFSDGFKLK